MNKLTQLLEKKFPDIYGDLRFSDCVLNKRLKSITVNFLVSKNFAKGKGDIEAYIVSLMPVSYAVKCSFKKSELDKDVIISAVKKYVKENFIAFYSKLSEQTIALENGERGITVVLKTDESLSGYVAAMQLEKKIKAHLESCFFGDFFVKLKTDADIMPLSRAAEKFLEEQNTYKLVFPKQIASVSQQKFFETVEILPEYLALNTFVAFDLETTGTDWQIDKITEIGAVKIVNGKITETFTTLINPQMPISKEITRLTGIDDAMVKNAPAIKEIVPDFFRFCFGAPLIAHNIDFDHRFISKAALDGGSGIKFGNTLIDTLKMARSGLKGLNNYKLNTVAEHLKIDLGTHHRALSDANTCAEIFIKLIKLENNACKKSSDVI